MMRKRPTDADVARVWQKSRNTAVAMKALGLTLYAIRKRIYRMRERGVKLKKMQAGPKAWRMYQKMMRTK